MQLETMGWVLCSCVCWMLKCFLPTGHGILFVLDCNNTYFTEHLPDSYLAACSNFFFCVVKLKVLILEFVTADWVLEYLNGSTVHHRQSPLHLPLLQQQRVKLNESALFSFLYNSMTNLANLLS